MLGTTDTMVRDASDVQATMHERRSRVSWAILYALLIAMTVLIALSMFGSPDSPSILGWLVFWTGVAAIFYEPRYGLYQLVFFSLVGDAILSEWYPFVKNFSSVESLLHVNRSLIFSPLETYLVLMFISWLGRGAMRRKLDFYTGPLFWPAMVFTGFIVFGLAYGIGRHGSVNIGLWEARPILYLPAMFVLTINLLTKREHVSHLLWCAMVALFLEGISGSWFFLVTIEGELSRVQAITEHSAAIHMNTMFMLIVAVWLYKGSPTKRLLLPLMAPPVILTYLATQRRSAFITIAVSLMLTGILLYRHSRKAFWAIAPATAVIGLLYTGAFWNSSGAVGMPARAIKSMVAPDANSEDTSSNEYRVIENINTGFTIHQRPLTGVGFGQKFFIIVPLPVISFFAWWEYITHNSVLWFWMKTGVGGFISMLFLVGMSLMVGARVTWRMPGGDLSAAAATMTFYVLMHFIYAYVDMSWDNQSMIYLGAAMGVIGCLERIVARPVVLPPKRWPWQPDPVAPPGLLPIPGREASA